MLGSTILRCEVIMPLPLQDAIGPSIMEPDEAHPVRLGSGVCLDCSCTEFKGDATKCSRSGCNHNYDRHM